MQNAETVLGVLRERGRRGLPLDELYRQLFNPHLYLLAYGRLYSNQGAMTPGADGDSVDGMSLDKIMRVIDALRHERYRFQPVKRVYIPKKNGKMRPLGLPAWSDKLVGEVMRLLLEAYYEPRFSDRSHGFRLRRGCHTALSEVETWTGTTWFIEGDISDCFGSLDHEVMISTLAEHIRDGRFLRLLRNMLRAGYLEDWTWNATLSGAPQGGVVHQSSPVFSWTGWTRSSKQYSSRNTPEGNAERATERSARWRTRSRVRGGVVTVPRCGSCASSGGDCPAGIQAIPASGGCGSPDTPTTTSSGSSDPRPRPRRSSTV